MRERNEEPSGIAEASRFLPGGTLSGGRFALCDKLGEGGMGVVYAARDQKTGSDVAIKTLLHLEPESLYRFKNEFRALADVRHRNLIRLGELYCEDAAWFFTMERVHGRPFLAHVRAGDAAKTLREAPPSSSSVVGATTTTTAQGHGKHEPSLPRTSTTTELPAALAATTVTAHMMAHASGAFDEERLREALRQLCLALCAVHESGHVHRDLKPSNVMVEESGRLVLLDFGLVQELRGDDGERGIRGTPHYMAPEQAAGEAIGPPADWYALGVMLFESLTGVLPFSGNSRQVLGAKIAAAAPAPSTLVPDVPPDLDALCRDLLAREPRHRPTSAEILRRLTAGHEAPRAPASVPFVGRGPELAVLRDALARLDQGNGDSILIVGEPGIGKTALARAFLKEAYADNPLTVVLAGRCYDQESVPFKAFDAIIDALSDHLRRLPETQAEALLAGGVYFLSMVFPVLRRVPAVTRVAPTSGLRVNPVELRAQAFEELKRLLAAIGRTAPLLLGIDDLQWADRDSLALLDELRTSPGVPRCLFVATMRATTDGAAHADASDEAIASVASFRKVALSGLPRAQAEALARAVRGTRSVPDSGALAALLAEAGGHPLFISELARSTAGPQTTTPRRLEDVLWSRIVGLDDHARRVLEFSALAGVPLHASVLSRAAGLLPNEAFHLFDELRASRLVRLQRASDTRVVEPYHDRIRESIVAHLKTADDLEERHLLLGRALLAETHEGELDAHIFAIVRHLNRASRRIDSPQERIALAELNLRASRQSKTATAYDAALRYVDAGLSLLADDAWAHDYVLARDLWSQRVELEFLAGRHDEALAHFAWLYDRLASDRERVDLLILKIELDTAQRRFREAIETAYRGLALCGVRLPKRATPPAVLAEYVRTRWYQGSRKPDDIVALPLLCDETKASAIKLLIALAPPAYFCDTPLLALAMMRIANLSFRFGVSELSAYGIAGYGLVLTGALGRPADGYALGQAAIRLDERFGHHVLSSKLHFVLGVFLMPWVRPFAEAQSVVRRGIELGRAHGDMIYEAYCAGKLCTVTLYEGRDLASTRAVIAKSRAITEQRRDVDMSTLCDLQDRFCAALQGPQPGAGLFGAPPTENAPPDGISDQRTPIAIYFYYLLSAQLLHFAGDDERCVAFLEEVEKRKDFQFAIVSPVDMHLFAAMAAARLWPSASAARRMKLARLLRRACGYLAKMERWNPRNFEARARIARAARLSTLGRPMTALDELAAAVRSARQHGDGKHESIALELMARLRRHEGSPADDAQALAIAAYHRWGAHARAAFLRTER